MKSVIMFSLLVAAASAQLIHPLHHPRTAFEVFPVPYLAAPALLHHPYHAIPAFQVAAAPLPIEVAPVAPVAEVKAVDAVVAAPVAEVKALEDKVVEVKALEAAVEAADAAVPMLKSANMDDAIEIVKVGDEEKKEEDMKMMKPELRQIFPVFTNGLGRQLEHVVFRRPDEITPIVAPMESKDGDAVVLTPAAATDLHRSSIGTQTRLHATFYPGFPAIL